MIIVYLYSLSSVSFASHSGLILFPGTMVIGRLLKRFLLQTRVQHTIYHDHYTICIAVFSCQLSGNYIGFMRGSTTMDRDRFVGQLNYFELSEREARERSATISAVSCPNLVPFFSVLHL